VHIELSNIRKEGRLMRVEKESRYKEMMDKR